MPEWVMVIIPVIASLAGFFVAHFLGSIQTRTNYDKQQKQLRYQKFYVPFIQKLYFNALHFKDEFCALPENDILDFINMIFDNIQYLGLSSQSLFHNLAYSYTIVANQKEQGKADSETGLEATNVCNIAFRRFADAVMTEAEALCNDLHLPNIAHTYRLRFKEISK